jgi:glucose/arabinose dehydrogenase
MLRLWKKNFILFIYLNNHNLYMMFLSMYTTVKGGFIIRKKSIVIVCCLILLIPSMYATGISHFPGKNTTSASNPIIQVETIKGGFGISVTLRNLGDTNLTNINWTIQCDGGLLLIGKKAQGTIPIIYREKSEIVKIPFVLGFGKFSITASAQSTEGSSDSLSREAKISLIRVIVIPGSTDALIATISRIAQGFRSPTVLTNAGDGSNRLFIAEQTGKIFIIKDEVKLNTPFLDLSSKIVKINPLYDERGLIGLVFHPDYETNGRFFVYYSAPKSGTGIDHEGTIAEYHVSADADIANSSSERIIFRIDEPEANHNGGQLAFGPDGYLYIGLGDGGGAGDQHGTIGNAQNISVPLGKILRIDVNSGTPYAIPADNPFVGIAGLDEIYAYGFRNPYKFSFDPATGKLFAGDVGQDIWEEVDIVENGGNYGWRILEGNHPYDLSLAGVLGINLSSLTPPIYDYSHDVGHSIIGGYVYRGSQSPLLIGNYVFGDWSESFTIPGGKLYYLNQTHPDEWTCFEFGLTSGKSLHRFIQGFGVDENGEIYFLTTRIMGSLTKSSEVWHLELL